MIGSQPIVQMLRIHTQTQSKAATPFHLLSNARSGNPQSPKMPTKCRPRQMKNKWLKRYSLYTYIYIYINIYIYRHTYIYIHVHLLGFYSSWGLPQKKNPGDDIQVTPPRWPRLAGTWRGSWGMRRGSWPCWAVDYMMLYIWMVLIGINRY